LLKNISTPQSTPLKFCACARCVARPTLAPLSGIAPYLVTSALALAQSYRQQVVITERGNFVNEILLHRSMRAANSMKGQIFRFGLQLTKQ